MLKRWKITLKNKKRKGIIFSHLYHHPWIGGMNLGYLIICTLNYLLLEKKLSRAWRSFHPHLHLRGLRLVNFPFPSTRGTRNLNPTTQTKKENYQTSWGSILNKSKDGFGEGSGNSWNWWNSFAWYNTIYHLESEVWRPWYGDDDDGRAFTVSSLVFAFHRVNLIFLDIFLIVNIFPQSQLLSWKLFHE